MYKSPSLTVDAVIICDNDFTVRRTSSAAIKHDVFNASKITFSNARKIPQNSSNFETQKPEVFDSFDFSTVLIKRKKNPYKDSWALPGGFVEYGETVESAVIREVKEETGLDIDLKTIVGVYSDPDRDPRGHTVTICYLAQKVGGTLKADSDASMVQCFKREEVSGLKLAFDHDVILKDAFKILNKGKIILRN